MGGFERVFEECTRALSACDLDSLVPCSIAPLMQSRGQRTRRVREPPNAHTKPNNPPVGPHISERAAAAAPNLRNAQTAAAFGADARLSLPKRNFVDAISSSCTFACRFHKSYSCSHGLFASHNQPLSEILPMI